MTSGGRRPPFAPPGSGGRGDERARPSRPPRGSSAPGSSGARHQGDVTAGPAAAISTPPVRYVPLGEFGRAVGLKGEIRLKSFTSTPIDIARYNPLLTPEGRSLTLSGVRTLPGTPDMLVARVAGITSRELAETLNRTTIGVPRERLSASEADDEYLHADLIGLKVEDADGTLLGTVLGISNFGAGDILDIRPARGGPSVLVPFETAFVPDVDVAGGRIVIAGAHLLEIDNTPEPG
jgi:16S rRNA processing protein RimM